MANKLLSVMVYFLMLIYCMFSMSYSARMKNFIDSNKVADNLKRLKAFRFYFFTIWNYMLQIIFLILAVTDEATKLVNLETIQRRVEKIRMFLFSTLVFPSSLLVMSVFWSIWHIDRELIFPKAIDEFYPSWLNHTLHTFIIIPLIVEVLVQFKNEGNRISRKRAAVILGIYCAAYQTLYLSVYFQHGVWLYPIYKVFSWTQRVSFILLQFFLILSYQQIGISLVSSKSASKIKAK